MWRSTFLALVALALPLQGFAWAALGHRLVGDVAAGQLSRPARAQVDALLKGEPEPTLGGVAYWADALRDLDPPRFKATSEWHYVDTKVPGCRFDLARDCPEGNCLVGAIEAQRRVLADPSQPIDARRDALKFIVHFVGDAHQPLHASDRDDLGGNRFQISLRTDIAPEAYARNRFVDGIMGTNLHSIWDYYVLASAGRAPAEYAHQLRKIRPPRAARSVREPLAWATESCRLIDARRLYPAEHVMDHTYLEAMRPLVEERIALAGARLAVLLNDTLK